MTTHELKTIAQCLTDLIDCDLPPKSRHVPTVLCKVIQDNLDSTLVKSSGKLNMANTGGIK